MSLLLPQCLYSSRPDFAPIQFFCRHQSLTPQILSKKCGLGRSLNPLGFRLNATSVSGAGADYSEEFVGPIRKQKKPSVAGVDQDELVEPIVLADPDSCFCEFNGVHIHHKICQDDEHIEYSPQAEGSSQVLDKPKKVGLPLVLLHGFGASVFSWNRVTKPLAKFVGAKVLAFDRPAFGLTSRVSHYGDSCTGSHDKKSLNPYSMAFSVLATLYFINILEAQKVVLMGHSAGCLVAVNTYFEAPERIAAMILVAPAIVAPLRRVMGKRKMEEDETPNRGPTNALWSVLMRIQFILLKFYQYVRGIILQMVNAMIDMANSLYKKALSAILQSAVAVNLIRTIIDKFGTAAVRYAWYDGKRVTDEILHGYTKPLRTKDWDRALLEYTISMIADTSTESKPPPAKRLHEITCPVMIVTGDNDRLVPSWNAKRLAHVIAGSHLEVISNCGHLPHEEKPEEFLLAVEKFLQRVFGAPAADFVQTAA